MKISGCEKIQRFAQNWFFFPFQNFNNPYIDNLDPLLWSYYYYILIT
jgi:hypothetical protein